MITGQLPCRLGEENSVSKTSLLAYWLCQHSFKKPEENNNPNNVSFQSDVELIFLLSMNMLLLLHLLLPSAFFFSPLCLFSQVGGLVHVSAETEDAN